MSRFHIILNINCCRVDTNAETITMRLLICSTKVESTIKGAAEVRRIIIRDTFLFKHLLQIS